MTTTTTDEHAFNISALREALGVTRGTFHELLDAARELRSVCELAVCDGCGAECSNFKQHIGGKRECIICVQGGATKPTGAVTTGRKDDAGKLRWDLVPWSSIEVVVRVLEHGAQKYGDENWRNVPNGRQRNFASTMRHLIASRRGEQCDPESGLDHLAHAVCGMLFMLELAAGSTEVNT